MHAGPQLPIQTLPPCERTQHPCRLSRSGPDAFILINNSSSLLTLPASNVAKPSTHSPFVEGLAPQALEVQRAGQHSVKRRAGVQKCGDLTLWDRVAASQVKR